MVDLDREGLIVNQLTVELPDGRQVNIDTDETTVQCLIQLAAGVERAPLPRRVDLEPPPPAPHQEEELALIFGGEDVGEIKEPDEEPVMGKVAEFPAATPPAQGGIGSGKAATARRPRVDKDGFALPVQSRTVEKDEMGYPVVERTAAPPPVVEEDDGTQI